MKIDLTKIDRESFNIKEGVIAGEVCYLVIPRGDFFDWTEDVLHFRSSIWNSEGKLISAGFKKFFNLEEKPAINPLKSFDAVNIIEKIDGSCLIVSRYKGKTIIRTRGTFDARTIPNGLEIDFLKKKYQDFFNFIESDSVVGDKGTKNHTYLFEWTTPTNKIVINYGDEPSLKLIGAINHPEYTLIPQIVLDSFAQQLNLTRPQRFEFANQTELVTTVKDFVGKEGVCVYYDNDQHIRKVKSSIYLKLHAFKSDLSVRRLAEVLFEKNKLLSYDPLPSEQFQRDFRTYIENTFDHECLLCAEPNITILFDKLTDWYDDLAMIGNFVSVNKELTQKEFAIKLISECKTKPHLADFGFRIRNGTFNPSVHQKKFVDLLKIV